MTPMQVRHKRAWVVAAVLAVVGVFSLIAFRSARMPLEVVPTSSKFHLSVDVTEGTKHVYNYGGKGLSFGYAFDRWMGEPGDRLRHTTSERSAVVWIRCDHLDFEVNTLQRAVGALKLPVEVGARTLPGPPDLRKQFRAELINTSGMRVPLKSIADFQHDRDKFVVLGWNLAGTLDDHKGSAIRIEAKDGTEVALLKVQ